MNSKEDGTTTKMSNALKVKLYRSDLAIVEEGAASTVQAAAEAGGGVLSLPPLRGDAAKAEAVVIGVRPQDLEIVPVSGKNRLKGKVSLIELLGSEKLVEVDFVGIRVQVQVRADFPVKEQSEVFVHFNPERLHVFDAESGQSIVNRSTL